MIIQIDEQYRVTTDPYQWIIQKKRARNGREDWRSQTFHPTFASALQSLGETMVRESNASTLSPGIGRSKNNHHHALPGPGRQY